MEIRGASLLSHNFLITLSWSWEQKSEQKQEKVPFAVSPLCCERAYLQTVIKSQHPAKFTTALCFIIWRMDLK